MLYYYRTHRLAIVIKHFSIANETQIQIFACAFVNMISHSLCSKIENRHK